MYEIRIKMTNTNNSLKNHERYILAIILNSRVNSKAKEPHIFIIG